MKGFFAPPEAGPEELESLPWAMTGPIRTADRARFSIRSTHREMGEYVDELCASFPVAPAGNRAAVTTYSVVHRVGGVSDWWAVYAGHRRISNCAQASVALTHLFGHLNRRVVAAAVPDAATLHAAAAAWDGRAVVLSGPTESGKSTLAAGLGLAGFEYLTDEVVVLDPETHEVAPYPKPLNIDPGSWSVLGRLRPVAPSAVPDIADTQWHVDPMRLPGGVAGGSRPVGALVRCRFTPHGRHRMQLMSPAEMVAEVIRDGFRPRTGVPAQLRLLGAIARNVPCYDLRFTTLDEAVQSISESVAPVRT